MHYPGGGGVSGAERSRPMNASPTPYRGYEAIDRPVVIVDCGRIVYLNGSANSLCDRDYLGAAAAELLGEELALLSSGADDVFLPDCRFLDAECALNFLAGSPCFYLFTLHDRARRELELRKELGSISASLREPLSLIIQASDGLRFAELNDHYKQYLSIIERAAFQLTGLTEHMSTVDDLSAPEPMLHTEYGDVTALLQGCVRDSASVFAQLGVTLETRLPDHPVDAVFDFHYLELMATILLATGLEHCGGGPVVLSLEETKKTYTIAVSIERNVSGMEDMFDLFTGKNATADGLGLSAAWHIARLHQGSLMIRRSAEGTQMSAVLHKGVPEGFFRQPVLFRAAISPVLTEFAGLVDSPFFHELRTKLAGRYFR